MAFRTDKVIFYHIPKTGGRWVKAAMIYAGVPYRRAKYYYGTDRKPPKELVKAHALRLKREHETPLGVLNEDKDKFWNLASKGYWSEVILKDKKLVLPKNSGSEIDPWPDNDKTLVGIHFAGGVLTGKFDHLDTQFDPPVAHYLKYLISDGQKT